MARKVVKTIKINNGQLTYEVNESGVGDWYRNGKPVDITKYRIYDPSIKRYRTLDDVYGNQNYRPVTPVVMDNYMKLAHEGLEERYSRIENRNQRYPTGDRFITVTAKRANGKPSSMHLATIPIAMLDSIAINSGRSNTPIAQNLGLVGKESTFGGYSDPLNNPWTSDDYRISGLVNNHAFLVTPKFEYSQALDKKLYSAPDYYENDERRIQVDEDAKYHMDRGIKGTTPHYSDNYLQDAFIRYNTNPSRYNPGQKNYVQMVNNIANELWSSPQIQDWWNSEGIKYYNKGKSESKNE